MGNAIQTHTHTYARALSHSLFGSHVPCSSPTDRTWKLLSHLCPHQPTNLLRHPDPRVPQAEYLRVNAELEAQAASLIIEADAVLRHREEVLMSPNASADLELSFDDELAQDSELRADTVSAYRDILGANIGGSAPASPARPASSRGRGSTSPTRGSRAVPSGEPDAVDEFISALSEVDNEVHHVP